MPKPAQHSSPPRSPGRDKPGWAVLSLDNPAGAGPKPSKPFCLAGTCQPDTSEFVNCSWCWPRVPFSLHTPSKADQASPQRLGDRGQEGIKFSSFASSVSPHQHTTASPHASVLCHTSYFTGQNTAQRWQSLLLPNGLYLWR